MTLTGEVLECWNDTDRGNTGMLGWHWHGKYWNLGMALTGEVLECWDDTDRGSTWILGRHWQGKHWNIGMTLTGEVLECWDDTDRGSTGILGWHWQGKYWNNSPPYIATFFALNHKQTDLGWKSFLQIERPLTIIFFLPFTEPPVGQGLLVLEASRSHSDTPHSGRTPLDEWSARRRDLYLTRHNTHKTQISMPPVGFELAIPTSERPQNNALDSETNRIGD